MCRKVPRGSGKQLLNPASRARVFGQPHLLLHAPALVGPDLQRASQQLLLALLVRTALHPSSLEWQGDDGCLRRGHQEDDSPEERAIALPPRLVSQRRALHNADA